MMTFTLALTAVTCSCVINKFISCVWVRYQFPLQLIFKECFLKIGSERVLLVAHDKRTAFLRLNAFEFREDIMHTCSGNDVCHHIRAVDNSICGMKDLRILQQKLQEETKKMYPTLSYIFVRKELVQSRKGLKVAVTIPSQVQEIAKESFCCVALRYLPFMVIITAQRDTNCPCIDLYVPAIYHVRVSFSRFLM